MAVSIDAGCWGPELRPVDLAQRQEKAALRPYASSLFKNENIPDRVQIGHRNMVAGSDCDLCYFAAARGSRGSYLRHLVLPAEYMSTQVVLCHFVKLS